LQASEACRVNNATFVTLKLVADIPWPFFVSPEKALLKISVRHARCRLLAG
jgi:hypothetical protein